MDRVTINQSIGAKKVDIKFSAHDAFPRQPSSGTLKDQIFESQIILKSLRAGKQKTLNRMVKIS
jgi:hypothetical protein